MELSVKLMILCSMWKDECLSHKKVYVDVASVSIANQRYYNKFNTKVFCNVICVSWNKEWNLTYILMVVLVRS